MSDTKILSVDIGKKNYACVILSCKLEKISDLIKRHSSRIKNFSGISKGEMPAAILEACNLCTVEWYDVTDITASTAQLSVRKLYEYFDKQFAKNSLFKTLNFVLVESQQASYVRATSSYDTNMDNLLLQQATLSYFYITRPDVYTTEWSPTYKTNTLGLRAEGGTYSQRKAVTVNFVRDRFIDRGNVPLLTHFESLKKKDDVADAICQGYSFVIKQFSTPARKRVLTARLCQPPQASDASEATCATDATEASDASSSAATCETDATSTSSRNESHSSDDAFDLNILAHGLSQDDD